MEKIKKLVAGFLNWLAVNVGYDGLLHIIVSALIVLFLLPFSPWWFAVIVAALAGAFKEIVWDLLLKKGNCSLKDALCDLAGIVIGLLGVF